MLWVKLDSIQPAIICQYAACATKLDKFIGFIVPLDVISTMVIFFCWSNCIIMHMVWAILYIIHAVQLLKFQELGQSINVSCELELDKLIIE